MAAEFEPYFEGDPYCSERKGGEKSQEELAEERARLNALFLKLQG